MAEAALSQLQVRGPRAGLQRAPADADPSACVASQAPDAKKEEFRAYLSKAGVIEALTKGARTASTPEARTHHAP